MKIAAGIGLIALCLVFFIKPSLTAHFDAKAPEIASFPISESSQIDISFADQLILENIAIPAYTAQRLKPSSKDWPSATIAPIADYLKSNNEKVLKITGYFLAEEGAIAVGSFKSMGLARAGFIANELRKLDISAPRIVLSDSLVDKKILSPALKFEFYNDNANIP